MYNMKIN